MKILVGIFFASSIVVRSQTNAFYVTDDRITNFNEFIPTVDQIEGAKHARESRPAEKDPEGNWGVVEEGFQLSIRLEKKRFTNGEPIQASIFLRNVSDKQLTYYFHSSPGIALRMFASRDGQRLYRNDEAKPGMTFKEQLKCAYSGHRWSAKLEPGTQREFIAQLTDVFNLSTNGEYKVHASHEIISLLNTNMPIRDRTNPFATNVVSGVATIYITNSSVK